MLPRVLPAYSQLLLMLAVPQIVAAQTSTSIGLTASPSPSIFGAIVTLTATLAPPTATGRVTFYDGAAVLGMGSISNGQAQLRTTLLSAGVRGLHAHYEGGAAYAASNSGTVPLSIHTIAGGGFQPAANFTIPSDPNDLVAADFNGDGKADLALATAFQLTVYLGNGDGTFQTPPAYSVAMSSLNLAVGDFNGDGKPDLAVLIAGNSLDILIGNGDGTFQSPASYPTGAQPRALAVSDFDRDGSADVVVVNQTDNNLSIFLGNGDGTLRPRANYPAGNMPISVAVADFDGDGNPDVAVGNYLGFDASVLRGNGDGSLQPAVHLSIGAPITGVVAGDFDGDGNLDLVTNSVSGTSFLKGKGDGTFQAPTLSNTGNYSAPYFAGDFNGDGKLDLSVVSYADSAVALMLGNGDGSFQPPVKYQVGNGPAFAVSVADFNGDGRTDLATPNKVDGTVSVLLGQAAAHPAVQAVSVSPTSGSANFQIFRFQFSDTAGAGDLAAVSGLIGDAGWPYYSCTVTYFRAQRALALLSNVGTVTTTTSPGSGSQQNSQCTLLSNESMVTDSGNTVTLAIAVQFKSSYLGGWTTFGNAVSASGLTTGWQALGTWTATITGQPLQAVSVQPASGGGASQTFTFVYSAPEGLSDFISAQVIVNSTQSNVSSCSLLANPNTGAVQLSSDSGGWLGPVTLGTAATLRNSQCLLNTNLSGGAFSGNTYTLRLALTFLPGFAGVKNIYAYAGSSIAGLSSTWQTLGTWSATPTPLPAYLISTFAGGQVPATSLPGTAADIGSPFGLAMDGSGNVYFGTSSAFVYKLDRQGMLTRVAGTGVVGAAGDNGPAISAQIGVASGLAVDRSGNLYIADTILSRVRKISPGGIITTVAGNGGFGFAGENVPATTAELQGPDGVAVDAAGNLYIADTGNNRIRKVSTNGIITTVAGSGVADFGGDGGPATAAQLNFPQGVTVDAAGALYVADSNNYRVRRVAPNGTISTLAGNGAYGFSGDGTAATGSMIGSPESVAVDSIGHVYIGEALGGRIRVVSPNGIISTVAGTGGFGFSGDGPTATTTIYSASGLAADTLGNLYFSDSFNHRVRKVAGAMVTTVAGGGTGDGGPAFFAGSLTPSGLAADSSGNIYVSDVQNQRIRKINAAGVISTLAGNGAPGYTGDGGPASSAQINSPGSIVVDAAGNVFIADSNNNRIRRINTSGVISTVAGNGSAGFLGDGGQAINAALNNPQGLALDGSGNLYIADTFNNAIRRVNPAGVISTVAGSGLEGSSGDNGPATNAQLTRPSSLAADAAGNLYFIEANQPHVRRVSAGGTITTFAGTGIAGFSGDGGPATSAQLNYPRGVAVDSDGNVFIMDANNARIRAVWSDSTISTIGGFGFDSASGDGGPALSAGMAVETACVDGAGRIYFAAADSTPSAGIRVLTLEGSAPLLTPLVRHLGWFAPGTSGQYTITISNSYLAGSTNGALTVTVLPSAGLTVTSISGTGWSCAGSTCTTSDALNSSSTYPQITVAVSVAADAPAQVTNRVIVSGGAALPAGAEDLTLLDALSVTESHSGVFQQGKSGAYTVTVSNRAAGVATSGAVTMTEVVPDGMTLVSMTGDLWTCPAGGTSCTRNDSLAGGVSYPPIAVTVNIAKNAASQLVNQVSASAGGFVAAAASDTVSILSECDLNADGSITVSDVQMLINEALGMAPGLIDLNSDGAVNVVDVQLAINAAFGMGCAVHE